jgi:hypothetical protein
MPPESFFTLWQFVEQRLCQRMIEEDDPPPEEHNHLCREEIKSPISKRKKRMEVINGAEASAFSTAFLVLMAGQVF